MIVIDRVLILIAMQACGTGAVAAAILKERKDEALYWGYDEEGEKRSADWAQRGLLWKHATAFEAYKFLPREVWNRTPKVFVSLRPSRERLAAHYMHLKSLGSAQPTFGAYLWSTSVETVEQFVTDRQGGILIDHFVDYSRLEESATEIFQTLGLRTDGLAGSNDKERKAANPGDFAIGDGDDAAIRNLCAWELDRFPACRSKS